MSAYSTLRISRSKAKSVLIEQLLGDIDDQLLEDCIDQILKPRLYNATIVEDYVDNDDDVF